MKEAIQALLTVIQLLALSMLLLATTSCDKGSQPHNESATPHENGVERPIPGPPEDKPISLTSTSASSSGPLSDAPSEVASEPPQPTSPTEEPLAPQQRRGLFRSGRTCFGPGSPSEGQAPTNAGEGQPDSASSTKGTSRKGWRLLWRGKPKQQPSDLPASE